MGDIEEGLFSSGVPYLKLGHGPPLLVASGLTPEHKNPTGMWRKQVLAWAEPFAEHFTVHVVNRRAGLAAGTTVADLAADYARAIEDDVGAPVAVHGTSSGGSVSLQLAVDHPQLVTRMVVAAAACRLSDSGRALQLEVARLTETGEPRKAWAQMMAAMAPPALGPLARGAGWLVGGTWTAEDPSDMIRVIEAEDLLDLEKSLGQVTAPTLVLGGTKDVFYSEDLFRRTANGIPAGRAVIYRGKGHVHVAGAKGPAATALGFLLG